MKYLIREMTQSDIEAVQKVAEVSWEDTYKDIIPIEIQKRFLASAYSHEMMEKRLETSFLYVVEIKGEIKGFANFSRVKTEGGVELGAIYLLPEKQGKGLGTQLLEKGIQSIDGIEKIYINVEEENLTGKAFYSNKGFQVVSEFEDDLYGHKSNMLRMVLRVDSKKG